MTHLWSGSSATHARVNAFCANGWLQRTPPMNALQCSQLRHSAIKAISQSKEWLPGAPANHLCEASRGSTSSRRNIGVTSMKQ